MHNSLFLTNPYTLGGNLLSCLKFEYLSYITKNNYPNNSFEYWMDLCLQEAMKSSNITSPNPSVGCLLIKNNEIIAKGNTQKYGDKHAERVAFEQLKDNANINDITAYVSLEPCSHYGKQPPCTELFCQHKINNVVVSCFDPDKNVNGNGISFLQKTAKNIYTGILAKETIAWMSPFLLSRTLNRPIFIAKWAQSIDGLLADDYMSSQWITNPISRSYTHWLRQKYDAILVGAGTIIHDFPKLNVRDVSYIANSSPIKIIFDPNGKLYKLSSEEIEKLNQTTFMDNSKILLINKHNNEYEYFIKKINKNIHLEIFYNNSNNVKDLILTALQSTQAFNLRERPIQSVMIEGGATLLNLLISENAIDIFHTFIAPMFISGNNNKIKLPINHIEFAKKYKAITIQALGNDILYEYMTEENFNILETILNLSTKFNRINI